MLFGQLNPDFKFKDGIYVSTESFQNNEPDYLLDSATIKAKDSSVKLGLLSMTPFGLRTQVTLNEPTKYLHSLPLKEIFVKNQDTTFLLKTRDIAAICLQGFLYINLQKELVRVPIQGAICHFTLEQASVTQYRALSQDTDRSWGTKFNHQAHQKMLYVATGKVYDFDYKQMDEVLQNDQDLHRSYSKLSKKKKKEKLFYYLLEFNKRHSL
jgi:hypothetical protein